MLHGASPDEAVSAHGPIAIRYRSPFFGFLTSMISTEQKIVVFLKELVIDLSCHQSIKFKNTGKMMERPSCSHESVTLPPILMKEKFKNFPSPVPGEAPGGFWNGPVPLSGSEHR